MVLCYETVVPITQSCIMKVEGLEKHFGFEGFVLDGITFSKDSVQIRVHRDKRRRMVCPNDGHRMALNRAVTREVYDLPVGTALCVKLVIETVQGKCMECGSSKTFLPDDIDEKATATSRLKRFASALCRSMAASEVANILPFSDDTIRRWDKKILEEQFGEVDVSNVTRILIDEKSIGKHHKYITLVLDADSGELLYIAAGKSSESLKPFFEKMPENVRQNIVVACMDRTAAYPSVVRQFCTNAEVVYDKFHIVKNLNEAVDNVRKDETKKAETEKRPIIKGERYNLLRHSEHLKPKQRASLKELLSLNEKLNEAYLLKEVFHNFWTYTYLGSAKKFLLDWTSDALASGLQPLIRFGKGLLRDERELLNILKFGATNGPIERFNNTVARIIARGFGYKDQRYLFLKLRQQSTKKPPFQSAIMR